MPVPACLTVVPNSDLCAWRDGVESLSPANPPCPGLYGEAWQKTHANMLDFLERFGEQAQDHGWTDLDLCGVHPQIGTVRVDYCGALSIAPKPVEAIGDSWLRYGAWTYRRDTPGIPKGVPIWTFKA